MITDASPDNGAATVLSAAALAIAAQDGGAGRIARIEHLGDQSHLLITLGPHRVTMLADLLAPFLAGQPVAIAARAPLLFDPARRRLEVV